MAIFSKKPMGGGLRDVIRCDETSYLIWKWHPAGTVSGENRRENSIRWGSSIRVAEGSVAAFFYSSDNGPTIEYIEGPFDGIIETSNLPVISNLIGLAYAGDSPFQAEVYFINLAQLIQFKFGVPYFDVFDPRYEDFGVPTAVRGTASFKITDYREFVRLHRLVNYDIDDLKRQVSDLVARYTKEVVANAPLDYGIPIVQIERRIATINDIVESKIKTRLFNDFGITVTGIDLEAIEVKKDSPGYKELKRLTKDITTAKVEAQAELDIKDMKDAQKWANVDRAGRTLIDMKEDAYERHKETKRKYGLLGTLASMGESIGKGISSTVDGLTKGKESGVDTPPPIPTESYHVAINGKSAGSFNIDDIVKMYMDGKISDNTLLWKKGMTEWKKLEEIENVYSAVSGVPPIPTEEK